jgi:hypothetical protein
MERFVTPEPLLVPEIEEADALSRADLIFLGVDHSGPSYEARIFFNNAEASIETPLDSDHGYVGSFNVFGHGACYGEEGHCDPALEFHDVFDLRPPHPLEPITRTVIVTEALAALEQEELVVTIVAVDHQDDEPKPSHALGLSEVRLLLYEP